MRSAFHISTTLLSLCVFTLIASPSFGMISVGVLTKEAAKDKYGITMHARKNGDAGIKVWLKFKKEGWLEKLTYTELRMEDNRGKHMISAQLQPNPVHHRQSKDITTVAFSANADQLAQCSFLVVCYGSNEGDVGYYLKTPPTEVAGSGVIRNHRIRRELRPFSGLTSHRRALCLTHCHGRSCDRHATFQRSTTKSAL